MEGRRAMAEERAMLQRIVALLYALAGLADVAAGRSAPVRCFTLWILRYAETVVRDFATGAPATTPAATPIDPAGDRRVEALRLAMRFRALARLIEREARPCFVIWREAGAPAAPPPFARMPALRDLLHALTALVALAGPAAPRVPAPDTS